MRSDEMHILRDEIAQALVRTKPMRRLGRIGFLGAIDYVKRGSGRSPHRRRHNRLEHSIGVAKLAEQYCDLVGMAQHDRNLVVAAALQVVKSFVAKRRSAMRFSLFCYSMRLIRIK